MTTVADCFVSLPLQSESIQTQSPDWSGKNCTFVSSLLEYFFPPIDQTVVHNCLTGFETKVHADWNISSPPVNQRLSKFFLVRAFSCFCPPWTSFAEILTWCCLCACPCISICFVCALRSLSVTVFSRESHRAFVFINMGEITLLGQKKKEKTKEKRFWDVTLFLYSHL